MTHAATDDTDRAFAAAQAAYLDRVVPGHRVSDVRWSGGSTQVIEFGAGPPLLLVHGGLGEAIQFAPILAELGRTRRALAVDRPGHGLASPFDHRGVDLLHVARLFIGEVMDALDLRRAAIAGVSMGGLWSLAFALAEPQRVEHLILLGSPAGVTPALPAMLRLGALPGLRALVRAMMRRPTRASVRDFWKQLLVVHPEHLDDELLDLLVHSQRRNAASWFSLIDRIASLRGMDRDLLIGDRWRRLAVPTTMVWGERDAWADPALGDAAAALNPNLRVVRIADAGHAPWIDAPGPTLAAITSALNETGQAHAR
jgi:pimeloyl-ACP methyl ester carboxylesterase